MHGYLIRSCRAEPTAELIKRDIQEYNYNLVARSPYIATITPLMEEIKINFVNKHFKYTSGQNSHRSMQGCIQIITKIVFHETVHDVLLLK